MSMRLRRYLLFRMDRQSCGCWQVNREVGTLEPGGIYIQIFREIFPADGEFAGNSYIRLLFYD